MKDKENIAINKNRKIHYASIVNEDILKLKKNELRDFIKKSYKALRQRIGSITKTFKNKGMEDIIPKYVYRAEKESILYGKFRNYTDEDLKNMTLKDFGQMRYAARRLQYNLSLKSLYAKSAFSELSQFQTNIKNKVGLELSERQTIILSDLMDIFSGKYSYTQYGAPQYYQKAWQDIGEFLIENDINSVLSEDDLMQLAKKIKDLDIERDLEKAELEWEEKQKKIEEDKKKYGDKWIDDSWW